MHALYFFHFLKILAAELKRELDSLPVTQLNPSALATLSNFQTQSETSQGVYVVHYDGQPVYVGKADNVSERLGQHLEKLSGRQRIDLALVGYKALLLDASMSTAANEKILISMFRDGRPNMWNGAGFGPKDPGKERDTTRPGWFDATYPIKDNLPINLTLPPNQKISLSDLFTAMKSQLPYVFRYAGSRADFSRDIDLSGVDHDAKSLLQAAVTFLGVGWKGAVLSYGMVLYQNNKEYLYGTEITP